MDASLYFYDMQDFQRRLKSESIHPITKRLWGSELVEAVGFPMAIQAPELIYECINHYNLDTRQIVLPNDIVLISINMKTMVNFLQVLEWEDFLDLTMGGAVSEFSAKKMV